MFFKFYCPQHLIFEFIAIILLKMFLYYKKYLKIYFSLARNNRKVRKSGEKSRFLILSWPCFLSVLAFWASCFLKKKCAQEIFSIVYYQSKWITYIYVLMRLILAINSWARRSNYLKIWSVVNIDNRVLWFCTAWIVKSLYFKGRNFQDFRDFCSFSQKFLLPRK